MRIRFNIVKHIMELIKDVNGAGFKDSSH